MYVTEQSYDKMVVASFVKQVPAYYGNRNCSQERAIDPYSASCKSTPHRHILLNSYLGLL
jgi:hypothetical protein